jgi:putative restriction endonuclease
MVNQVERAYRAWSILVGLAINQAKTMTYGELANHLGVHHRAIRYVLSEIQDYCLREALPPLTILVVNADTGLPGHGFIAWSMDDLDRGRIEVGAFAWDSLENPFVYAADGTTEHDLVNTLVTRPESAADVFARVKVRGTAQIIFRKVLLKVYETRCAFCGLTFRDALEAAHLIPWAEASPKQRLDPSNGLLLCSTHHRLLDAGLITISNSGIVTCREPSGLSQTYSKMDKAVTVSLHGKCANLPLSDEHRPSKLALDKHHANHQWGDLA